MFQIQKSLALSFECLYYLITKIANIFEINIKWVGANKADIFHFGIFIDCKRSAIIDLLFN